MAHRDPKVRAPCFPKYQSEYGVCIESTSIHIQALQFQPEYKSQVHEPYNLMNDFKILPVKNQVPGVNKFRI